VQIDLSQRGLIPGDARLVRMAILQNKQLAVLKLGYNNLGDVGVSILTEGLGRKEASHVKLCSLDLGFNNIGDAGCAALCQAAIAEKLRTLYLAGNLIGEDGALAIADLIRKSERRLQKLYLTGNALGPDGVTAIVSAILDEEQRHFNVDESVTTELADLGERHDTSNPQSPEEQSQRGFMQELYLGGTEMGRTGCESMARLLRYTCKLLVLSLPNCEINDESLALLASSIKTNRANLPLQSLQLSFNQITCKGVESLVNALWGTHTLKELLIDNNEISDRGAQHIAAVLLPQVRSMETLNVGFNQIKPTGIKILLKSVVDSGSTLQSLSISGNPIDTSAAKAISYALAYNRSLVSLSLVHCNIGHEGQRHISAGIVSNSRIALRELSGFNIGTVIVTLGFPGPMEAWNNCQVLEFLRAMWDRHRKNGGQSQCGDDVDPNFGEGSLQEDEKMIDPLNFLGGAGPMRSAPEDATIVVEVAKKAFAQYTERGDAFFSTQRSEDVTDRLSYPLVIGDIMPTSSGHELSSDPHGTHDHPNSNGNRSAGAFMPTNKVASFIATPETPRQAVSDPARKKRLAEWLNANSKQIQKVAQQPFHAGELWRLHQHYFTPVVKETGGEYVPNSSILSANSDGKASSSVPHVSISSSSENPCGLMSDNAVSALSESSHFAIQAPRNQLASLPILKRKVSYGCLREVSAFSSDAGVEVRSALSCAPTGQEATPMAMEGRPTIHSMPPNTKRARRNRSRISFLPRTKAKLDSYLDKCHEKALITMRQLYYIERAILDGSVYPLDEASCSSTKHRPLTHLSGDYALDAEMIVVDML
jgi:Ran GTPase-activating protein (RanGAP) involved in mRNA processing and transport